jgi:hypothetical protein
METSKLLYTITEDVGDSMITDKNLINLFGKVSGDEFEDLIKMDYNNLLQLPNQNQHKVIKYPNF